MPRNADFIKKIMIRLIWYDGCVKLLAKSDQKICKSDLQIATGRELEFPHTMNYAVNAKNFTHPHVIEGAAKGTAKLVGKSTTYNIEGVTATDKTKDLIL